MAMNKRERWVGIITVAVLALLGVYQFVVDPLLIRRQELARQVADAKDAIQRNGDLSDRSKRAGRQWREMISGGLRKDASETESVLLHSLRDWAQDANMSLSGLTPARPEKDKDFYRITVRATGSGRMESIGRFLHRIQTASIPVRVTELQINSRGREGNDDLSVQMSISTVYLAPENETRAGVAMVRNQGVTP